MAQAAGRCRRAVYGAYKKTQHLSPAATAAHFLYDRLYRLVQPEARSCRYRPSACESVPYAGPVQLSDMRVAAVCDEMTYRSLLPVCQLHFVTPHNWLRVFEQVRPEVFFCEAAWSGINRYPDVWRGKIYRSDRIRFENRRDLLRILEYCREREIPTVFWNKEDPAYFGSRDYDFTDTALRFDTVLTTAAECAGKYRALGAPRVGVLPFGFSPQIYHPLGSGEKENTAVFAGSWYADQPERCADMQRVFDEVIRSGIELCIYDRHYGTDNPVHLYPGKYRPYLRPAVDYRKLGDIYRRARYAVNINTVTGSQTMFARRVFEIMACNTLVISNESPGLRRLFPDSIWYAGSRPPQAQEEASRLSNLREVFLHHTFRTKLCGALAGAGILPQETLPGLLLVYTEAAGDINACRAHFERADYPVKGAALWRDGELQPLPGIPFRDEKDFCFFIPLSGLEEMGGLPFFCSQFSYLDADAGVRPGAPGFCYGPADRLGTLFPLQLLRQVMDRPMAPWQKVFRIPNTGGND